MTTYGVDVSNHNAGLSLAAVKAQGYDFAIAKVTEGTGYVDPFYQGFRADAQKAKMLFAGYHLLHRGQARKQADLFCTHLGDVTIPGMIDFEPMGNSKPRMRDAIAFLARCEKHGVHITLDYLPEWYWQAIGRPKLTGLPAEVQSSYPSNRHDHGTSLYPGDSAAQWDGFGGVAPTILQFSSTGLIDGFAGNVDLDAFRGTRAELAALGLFKDYGHPAEHEHPRGNPHPAKHPSHVPWVRWWRARQRVKRLRARLRRS